MTTALDEALFRLMDAEGTWATVLTEKEIQLLLLRKSGSTLETLAAHAGLSVCGVRRLLYGDGRGRVRRGGVFGRLRGLAQKRRLAAGA